MDDWSFDGQKDLFALNGGKLDSVMDALASNTFDQLSVAKLFQERDISQTVHIVPCKPSVSTKEEEGMKRKKILKKPNRTNSQPKNLSLKKVTFEVEKFAADECDDVTERNEARARLAIRLGARPPKNRFINYKQLKEERNAKKNSEDDFDKLSALKALKKLSMKKKVKAKKLRRK